LKTSEAITEVHLENDFWQRFQARQRDWCLSSNRNPRFNIIFRGARCLLLFCCKFRFNVFSPKSHGQISITATQSSFFLDVWFFQQSWRKDWTSVCSHIFRNETNKLLSPQNELFHQLLVWLLNNAVISSNRRQFTSVSSCVHEHRSVYVKVRPCTGRHNGMCMEGMKLQRTWGWLSQRLFSGTA
jgi:hypothetical protein